MFYSVGAHERSAQGLRHSHSGQQRIPWEHPFVVVYGVAWRGFCDQHASLAGCMSNWKDFFNKLCSLWSLPGLLGTTAVDDDAIIPFKIRLPTSIDDVPDLPLHPLDNSWASDGSRFWIQVDCKAIADLLTGQASLQQEDHRPLFVRISCPLLPLHNAGCKPQADHPEFIVLSSVNATQSQTIQQMQLWTRRSTGCDNQTSNKLLQQS